MSLPDTIFFSSLYSVGVIQVTVRGRYTALRLDWMPVCFEAAHEVGTRVHTVVAFLACRSYWTVFGLGQRGHSCLSGEFLGVAILGFFAQALQ